MGCPGQRSDKEGGHLSWLRDLSFASVSPSHPLTWQGQTLGPRFLQTVCSEGETLKGLMSKSPPTPAPAPCPSSSPGCVDRCRQPSPAGLQGAASPPAQPCPAMPSPAQLAQGSPGYCIPATSFCGSGQQST